MPHSCYLLEEIHPCESGMFDGIVDMVYCMTLIGSERSKTLHRKIKRSRIATTVTIQYNHGYKCDGKGLKIRDARSDLTHALANIFRHAAEKGYENILVLEDDFIVDTLYVKQHDIDRVGEFTKSNPFDLYNLGGHSFVSYPVGLHHRRAIHSRMSHAIIYNKSYFNKYISYVERLKYDIHCDDVHNKIPDCLVYFYYKPLLFQIFPCTENKATSWGKETKGIIDVVIESFELDKDHANFQLFFGFLMWWFEISLISLIISVMVWKTSIKN